MVRDEFAYLDFDDKGRFKEPEHEKEESSAFDMLDFFSLKQQDKEIHSITYNHEVYSGFDFYYL